MGLGDEGADGAMTPQNFWARTDPAPLTLWCGLSASKTLWLAMSCNICLLRGPISKNLKAFHCIATQTGSFCSLLAIVRTECVCSFFSLRRDGEEFLDMRVEKWHLWRLFSFVWRPHNWITGCNCWTQILLAISPPGREEISVHLHPSGVFTLSLRTTPSGQRVKSFSITVYSEREE